MTSEQTASTPSRTNEKADAESGTNSSSPADPYAHLPRHQAAILRRQVHAPDPRHSVGNLYRYASRLELAALAVSALCAAASGAALPVMTVLFGGLQGVFQDYSTREDASYDSFKRGMTSYVLYFVYLGVGEFAVTYVSTVGFIHVGERIAAKIRRAYLESCVSQNMAFFDAFGAGEATASITSDVNLVQDGISEKVALTLSAVATFVAAFVIGFVNYWKLTLILSCVVVAWSLNMTLTSRFMLGNMGRYFAAYAEGGNLAGEVLASVRSAIAFGAQGRLAGQYDAHVARAEHYGIRFKSATGLMVAGLQVVMILGYALAFWQGSKFLVEGAITLSKFVTVLMAVMVGAFTLGNVAPNVQAFTTAIAAAGRIFAVIDRASPMDFRDDAGLTLDKVQGHVRLENVQHVYPSRPGVTVLRGVSLDVPAGKTTALVGASGCGKSTVVGLLERFYDPVEGAIYLDGHDISKMNLHWLRQQMALVSQEPTLFGVTIFENICHGLSGIEKYRSESPDMQRERVVEAAKKANAHDFITQLPQGYDTNVGQKGFMLSGGQKQRIAIARALVSDPQILLLDEATAALDSQSEDSVIKALRSASAGRTTITIAHRLYTIKDADNIVVMSGGLVEEQGTHDELLGRQGAYAKLVAAQSLEGKGSHPAASQDISEGSGTKAGQGDGDEATSPGAETGLVNYPTQEPSAEQKRYSLWTLFKFIIALNGPEWKLMLLGCLFSIICGLGNPTTAVFFAKQIATLSRPMPPHSSSEVKQDSDFWSSMYVMLAFVLCLAFAIQGISFAKTSEALVRRVRSKAFQALLRQDVSFFDEDANTPGALTSLLSSEATHVAGLSGVTLGTLIISISTLISACALALAIGWKLSLVCIAALPVLTGCGFLHFWVLARFAMRSKAAYESSAAYASEAISAIRTVAALRREAGVVETYRQSLAAQQRRGLISTLKSSGAYAASQSCLFLCFALCFWYGGTLIGRREYTMFQFFLCFMSVLFGAQNVSLIFSFAPDMGKAVSAAHQLKTLFDRQPSIDTWSETGGQIDRFSNRIELRNINFHYPTRPSQPVLRGLSLTIKRGQYVALVGGSGCGKSTALALLERFYDPQSGEILIDGRNIETLNVNRYRRLIALVSQEPTLYHGSVKDNILLGSPSGDASDEEIERVAREANIYDFITSLPDGLNTIVGHKGDLLSGGQQQRIAIARSLIRNPEILLLDEATSALDTTSEKVVQAALDQAAKGRTTVAVAHRLSTIQKADVIYVLDKGEVIASGTHSELMEKSERYAELVNLQSLGS